MFTRPQRRFCCLFFGLLVSMMLGVAQSYALGGPRTLSDAVREVNLHIASLTKSSSRLRTLSYESLKLNEKVVTIVQKRGVEAQKMTHQKTLTLTKDEAFQFFVNKRLKKLRKMSPVMNTSKAPLPGYKKFKEHQAEALQKIQDDAVPLREELWGKKYDRDSLERLNALLSRTYQLRRNGEWGGKPHRTVQILVAPGDEGAVLVRQRVTILRQPKDGSDMKVDIPLENVRAFLEGKLDKNLRKLKIQITDPKPHMKWGQIERARARKFSSSDGTSGKRVKKNDGSSAGGT